MNPLPDPDQRLPLPRISCARALRRLGVMAVEFVILAGLSLYSAPAVAASLVHPDTIISYDGAYGGDLAKAAVLLPGGDLAVAGHLKASNSPEQHTSAVLMRLGAEGWTNITELGNVVPGIKDDSSEAFNDLAIDSEGNLIAGGVLSGSYGGDGYHQTALLQKLNPAGQLLWQRTFHVGPWNAVNRVTIDAQDNIYAAGNVFGGWTTEENKWAIWKYNPNGDLQPGYPFYYNLSTTHQAVDRAFGIALDSQGNQVVCGTRGGVAGNRDWHVRKYDSGNALVWEATYAGAGGRVDDAYDVVIDAADNPIVVGYVDEGAPAGAADYDWLMIKYNAADGTELWRKSWTSEPGRSEQALAVELDALGNVLIGGNTRDEQGEVHWRLSRRSGEDGSLLSEQTWEDDAIGGIYDVLYRNREIVLSGYHHNGTDHEWRVARAEPPLPRISQFNWTSEGQLSLQWQSTFAPVELLYTPNLANPQWQPVIGPVTDPAWQGSLPGLDQIVGYFQLLEVE